MNRKDTRKKQMESINTLISIARDECLQAIEFGLQWNIEQSAADNDDPFLTKISRVLTIRYELPVKEIESIKLVRSFFNNQGISDENVMTDTLTEYLESIKSEIIPNMYLTTDVCDVIVKDFVGFENWFRKIR